MYKITVFKMGSDYGNIQPQDIEIVKREALKEAKKVVRTLKKKYELVNHAGHIVNFSTQTELTTNF